MEGGSPVKQQERWGVAPESTMTQKIKRLNLITQTLGKLACTEHTPKNVNPNHKQTKGRICELPSEVGMFFLGEA